ncbi:MAG: hypothetical protein ACI4QA_08195 [Candidatus Spyradosoma sp.]
MKTAFPVAALVAVICAGCTNPTYERTVTTTYDKDGNVVSCVVTDRITQTDPHSQPLNEVFSRAAFEGVPKTRNASPAE